MNIAPYELARHFFIHHTKLNTCTSATDKQLGGYVVEYDRMTFAIVHGAGHLVPGERPCAWVAELVARYTSHFIRRTCTSRVTQGMGLIFLPLF